MTCAPPRRPRVPLRDAPLEFAREAAANRVHVLPQQGPAGSITRHVTVLCGTALTVRAGARVTQAGAAAALGVPRLAVSELEAGTRRLAAAELARCAALYCRPATWFLDGGPAEAVARLVAGLPPSDQETVTRFAEFLAARQAARPREKIR